jgi:hypothetical protein
VTNKQTELHFHISMMPDLNPVLLYSLFSLYNVKMWKGTRSFNIRASICRKHNRTSNITIVGFQVPTAVVTKAAIFCNIVPCSPYVNRRFGGTYYFHLQGKKSVEREPSVQQVGRQCLATTWRYFPEDGSIQYEDHSVYKTIAIPSENETSNYLTSQ